MRLKITSRWKIRNDFRPERPENRSGRRAARRMALLLAFVMALSMPLAAAAENSDSADADITNEIAALTRTVRQDGEPLLYGTTTVESTDDDGNTTTETIDVYPVESEDNITVTYNATMDMRVLGATFLQTIQSYDSGVSDAWDALEIYENYITDSTVIYLTFQMDSDVLLSSVNTDDGLSALAEEIILESDMFTFSGSSSDLTINTSTNTLTITCRWSSTLADSNYAADGSLDPMIYLYNVELPITDEWGTTTDEDGTTSANTSLTIANVGTVSGTMCASIPATVNGYSTTVSVSKSIDGGSTEDTFILTTDADDVKISVPGIAKYILVTTQTDGSDGTATTTTEEITDSVDAGETVTFELVSNVPNALLGRVTWEYDEDSEEAVISSGQTYEVVFHDVLSTGAENDEDESDDEAETDNGDDTGSTDSETGADDGDEGDAGFSLDTDSFTVKLVYNGSNSSVASETTVNSKYYTVTAADATDGNGNVIVSDGCSFELSIDLIALYSANVLTEEMILGGTDIVVTYEATLSEDAAPGKYPNTAWVTYPEGESVQDEVDVYTYGLTIYKYSEETTTTYSTDEDGNQTSSTQDVVTPLENVGFTVYRTRTKSTNEDGETVYAYSDPIAAGETTEEDSDSSDSETSDGDTDSSAASEAASGDSESSTSEAAEADGDSSDQITSADDADGSSDASSAEASGEDTDSSAAEASDGDGDDDTKSAASNAYVFYTDEEGYITLEGLEAGTYYIEEVEGLDGYVWSSTVQEITLGDTVGVYSVKISIENSPVPQTGGVGQWWLTLLGLILAGAAGGLLANRRWRRLYGRSFCAIVLAAAVALSYTSVTSLAGSSESGTATVTEDNAAGKSSSDESSTDAGSSDAGSSNSGSTDSGSGGSTDSGSGGSTGGSSGGSTGGGSSDSGSSDSGSSDSGSTGGSGSSDGSSGGSSDGGSSDSGSGESNSGGDSTDPGSTDGGGSSDGSSGGSSDGGSSDSGSGESNSDGDSTDPGSTDGGGSSDDSSGGSSDDGSSDSDSPDGGSGDDPLTDGDSDGEDSDGDGASDDTDDETSDEEEEDDDEDEEDDEDELLTADLEEETGETGNLSASSFDASACVYWDIDDSSNKYDSESSYITSVKLGGTSIAFGESTDEGGWSGGASLGGIYPGASSGTSESAELVITPADGWYVSGVRIVCAVDGDGSNNDTVSPYSCAAASAGKAYNKSFSEDDAGSEGALTAEVSSLYFSHEGVSGGDNDEQEVVYFVLIKVSQADPDEEEAEEEEDEDEEVAAAAEEAETITTFGLKVYVVDNATTSDDYTYLSGAKFVLYREDESGNKEYYVSAEEATEESEAAAEAEESDEEDDSAEEDDSEEEDAETSDEENVTGAETDADGSDGSDGSDEGSEGESDGSAETKDSSDSADVTSGAGAEDSGDSTDASGDGNSNAGDSGSSGSSGTADSVAGNAEERGSDGADAGTVGSGSDSADAGTEESGTTNVSSSGESSAAGTVSMSGAGRNAVAGRFGAAMRPGSTASAGSGIVLLSSTANTGAVSASDEDADSGNGTDSNAENDASDGAEAGSGDGSGEGPDETGSGSDGSGGTADGGSDSGSSDADSSGDAGDSSDVDTGAGSDGSDGTDDGSGGSGDADGLTGDGSDEADGLTGDGSDEADGLTGDGSGDADSSTGDGSGDADDDVIAAAEDGEDSPDDGTEDGSDGDEVSSDDDSNDTDDSDAVTYVATWSSDEDDAEIFVSDENGMITIEGLEEGTYYLVQTEAPEHYVASSAAKEVTISDPSAAEDASDDAAAAASDESDDAVTVVDESGDDAVTVSDESWDAEGYYVVVVSDAKIPGTGGMGTEPFLPAGVAVAVISGAALAAGRRRRSREDDDCEGAVI